MSNPVSTLAGGNQSRLVATSRRGQTTLRNRRTRPGCSLMNLHRQKARKTQAPNPTEACSPSERRKQRARDLQTSFNGDAFPRTPEAARLTRVDTPAPLDSPKGMASRRRVGLPEHSQRIVSEKEKPRGKPRDIAAASPPADAFETQAKTRRGRRGAGKSQQECSLSSEGEERLVKRKAARPKRYAGQHQRSVAAPPITRPKTSMATSPGSSSSGAVAVRGTFSFTVPNASPNAGDRKRKKKRKRLRPREDHDEEYIPGGKRQKTMPQEPQEPIVIDSGSEEEAAPQLQPRRSRRTHSAISAPVLCVKCPGPSESSHHVGLKLVLSSESESFEMYHESEQVFLFFFKELQHVYLYCGPGGEEQGIRLIVLVLPEEKERPEPLEGQRHPCEFSGDAHSTKLTPLAMQAQLERGWVILVKEDSIQFRIERLKKFFPGLFRCYSHEEPDDTVSAALHQEWVQCRKAAASNVFGNLVSSSPALGELSTRRSSRLADKELPPALRPVRQCLTLEQAKEVVATYPPGRGGVTITRGDLIRLAPEQLLNDSIIDFYIQRLKGFHLPASSVDVGLFHFYGCFFWKKLIGKRGSKGFNRDVLSWTKDVNIFEKRYLVIPINSEAHWTLAIICNPGKARYGVRVPRQEVRKFRGERMNHEQSDDVHPCIFFLDSLRVSQRVNRHAKHLRQYLREEWKDKQSQYPERRGQRCPEFNGAEMPIYAPDVPQQDNGTDCGIFVLKFVEDFCRSPHTCLVKFLAMPNIPLHRVNSIRTFIEEDIKRVQSGDDSFNTAVQPFPRFDFSELDGIPERHVEGEQDGVARDGHSEEEEVEEEEEEEDALRPRPGQERRKIGSQRPEEANESTYHGLMEEIDKDVQRHTGMDVENSDEEFVRDAHCVGQPGSQERSGEDSEDPMDVERTPQEPTTSQEGSDGKMELDCLPSPPTPPTPPTPQSVESISPLREPPNFCVDADGEESRRPAACRALWDADEHGSDIDVMDDEEAAMPSPTRRFSPDRSQRHTMKHGTDRKRLSDFAADMPLIPPPVSTTPLPDSLRPPPVTDDVDGDDDETANVEECDTPREQLLFVSEEQEEGVDGSGSGEVEEVEEVEEVAHVTGEQGTDGKEPGAPETIEEVQMSSVEHDQPTVLVVADSFEESIEDDDDEDFVPGRRRMDPVVRTTRSAVRAKRKRRKVRKRTGPLDKHVKRAAPIRIPSLSDDDV